jgi:small-conductance mechanosensitive channel
MRDMLSVAEMLRGFFASIARYFVLTVTVLAVLSQFGIQTTSLVAVIGAASLAIGLALQGTLSNLAAGVMLLIFRPFRIGHSVTVGGNTGTVRSLSLFWTEVVTDANTQVIIPNASVWGQPIRNMITYYRACADSADRRSGFRRLGLERRLRPHQGHRDCNGQSPDHPSPHPQ